MIKTLLHDNWTLRAAGNLEEVPASVANRDIPATVPGTVHTDLLAEGLIPDPYLDRNENDVQWIGHTDWVYSCTFDAPSNFNDFDRVDLSCEGLDTVARIELNGVLLGETQNMHHSHRFDAKVALREGRNELVITFASAALYARAMRDRLGDLPNTYPTFEPYQFIRKMACNFGWDWGPTLITAGIWKPISLEMWNTARIVAVRPLIRHVDEKKAIVDVFVDFERIGDPELDLLVELTSPHGVVADASTHVAHGATEAHTHFEIDDPELWWPRGYGEHPLYLLHVELDTESAVVEEWATRIGLREVTLNTQPDDIGAQWTIEINGKPIWVKGANWIPDDCFPHRVDEARYRQRIKQAIESNMNLLRIWGGGTYESETFYQVCDELGVLVWQDFPFACACYPEEAPFDRLVEEEARHNIARLSKHPSLIMWNGSNENIWGYFDWPWRGTTWKEAVEGRTWGLGFYTGLLPRLVNEVDPTRPYWASSPYSGTMDIHPLDDNYGNKHIWDAWNTVDYSIYREYTPRFCSEFGHQAPPTYATLQRSIPADALTPDSPSMLHHQKADGGNDKLNTRLAEHFEIPENFDDWLYVTQLNQARALTVGVEWFRSRQPVCMGSIYWQINDCWPVTSWASVDGYGRLKPLWYATRRFYAERLLTVQAENEGLNVYACNDTESEWQGDFELLVLNLSGETVLNETFSHAIAPRSCEAVMRTGELGSFTFDASTQYVCVRSAEARTAYFGATDKELPYPEPQFEALLEPGNGTQRLTITAQSLLRDLCIFADRLDPEATVSEQLVTLLPGESFTFEICTSQRLNQQELTAPPVLQCANRFGRKV